MAGLIGMMAAGAAKGYSGGRGNELAQENEFNLRVALQDAQMDKELRLKEAGYQMEDKRNAAEMERNKGYMADVANEDGTTRKATVNDGANRAMQSGDLKTAETFAKMSPKDSNSFESVKLDDGSIMAFDKSSGTAKVVLEGGKQFDVPKSELELAWRMAGGDPKKAGDILVSQKARIAAAGRAPERASDDDQSYADWKRKPENKGKGRDDYSKEKATWGKDIGYDTVTETTSQNDQLGYPVKQTKVTSKVPRNENKPTNKVGKWVPGKGLVYD